MGAIVNTQCDSCDIDRQDFLGSGMFAGGAQLCACTHCRRLIAKRTRVLSDSVAPGEPRCPYCKRLVTPVWPPADSADWSEDEPPVTCPACGGTLSFQMVGVWD